MLVRLLYASRATETVSRALAESILSESHERNLARGITGALCLYENGEIFLQMLEGGREAVNELYGSIVRDPRHKDVTLLDYSEIEVRHFAGWRMGRVDLNRINLKTVLKYSEGPRLDPFRMSGSAALALLDDLLVSAAITSPTD